MSNGSRGLPPKKGSRTAPKMSSSKEKEKKKKKAKKKTRTSHK